MHDEFSHFSQVRQTQVFAAKICNFEQVTDYISKKR